jgi:diadenosine tetraphosphate (Ap4A) HIT family hydrolase
VKDPKDPCLFCAPHGITRQNQYAYCTRDSYPVSRGHALIIPFRHCADFFELDPEEHAACCELLVAERDAIAEEFEPDGYNVGVKVGPAGGQSVFHVHVHLIPRYQGDHPRPHGGVRHILPDKAHYPRTGLRAP